jgi:eukaryotic-like serine/threonine-protein kinase
MPIALGTILNNRYRIDEFVGRGGMAEVYRVWDLQRSVTLAIKVLNPDLAEDKIFFRRFQREAQTLSKLQHPSILRFYGLETSNGIVFMVLDYVDGVTLRKLIHLENKPLSLALVSEIINPICSALFFAHKLGVVHCDIKPANIMVDRGGRVLVTDFGIARLTESATSTLVGAGTPAYMSPEQIKGQDPLPTMDIYSLGVILYEMLTGGERPFIGESARTTGSTSEKIRWEQLHSDPPSPSQYNPYLPPALSALTVECLAKDPRKRVASMQELQQRINEIIPPGNGKELVRFMSQPVVDPEFHTKVSQNQPPKLVGYYPPEQNSKRNPLGLILIGATLLMALMIFIGVSLFTGIRGSGVFNFLAPVTNTPTITSTSTTTPTPIRTNTPTKTLMPTLTPTQTVIPTETPRPTSTHAKYPTKTPISGKVGIYVFNQSGVPMNVYVSKDPIISQLPSGENSFFKITPGLWAIQVCKGSRSSCRTSTRYNLLEPYYILTIYSESHVELEVDKRK